MPATKDANTGKWICQFYYTDWTGERKKKLKRGFVTKREALEWEREFLQSKQSDMGMSFANFIEIYFEDIKTRIRQSTYRTKRYIVDLKITPYFGKKPISEIKAADVRKWQNQMISYKDKNGKPYSQTYLKTVNNQLTAIFNFAVKYYDLKENPCHKAGSMGKSNADEMQFWTTEEFNTFVAQVQDKPQSYAAFMTLYYTGMRIGELLALTKADIDLDAKTISINKSYQRLEKSDIITAPKTPKSNRIVSIPDFLCQCLKEYLAQRFELEPAERIFPFTKHFLTKEMVRGCEHSGAKKIRLHDLRHSHASHLIEMGFSPLLIADRLGHEKVETTMETYSHLYPGKQSEVSDKLQASFHAPQTPEA